MKELKFNVTGERRKELVEIISGIVGMKPVYLRMPTCSYVVSNITVTKDGTVQYDDRTGDDLMERVVHALAGAGFSAQEQAEEADMQEEQIQPEHIGDVQEAEGDRLNIEMPMDGFTEEAMGRLKKLVEAKGNLIRKAFGTEDLTIIQKNDRIIFPWFTIAGPEDTQAYLKFATLLCAMAKNAKRITAKEKETENEKYDFRCFLLRLGFIGQEYKEDRKILLRNLTGSSAFKRGKVEA